MLSQSTGRASIEAPSVWKIRLTFAFCRAKAIWMPKKPNEMLKICQNESRGLSIWAMASSPVFSFFCSLAEMRAAVERR